MPQPRKTEEQRRTERFCELYRIGKVRINATEEQISEIMGISRPTVLEMRRNPGKNVSLDEFVRFGKTFEWTDDDFLAIIHAYKKK